MSACCSTERERLAIANERRRQLLADGGRGRADGARPARLVVVILIAFVALALFSGRCRSHLTGAARDAPPEPADLEQALAQMPADAARFAFTDWRRVRGYHGFKGDSHRTSRDERAAYRLDVMKMSHAAANLNVRRTLLERGTSPRREVVYGREFTLEEAAVDGPILLFRLAPTAALRTSTGWPRTLLGWVQDGDARFVTCNDF
ncbi:MAG: hypothetical protein R3248_00250 [Candidatus Promineifilaceae bacterium]|nr:hypothetical protein [Candidatus Promineifilaceae bacterium]